MTVRCVPCSVCGEVLYSPETATEFDCVVCRAEYRFANGTWGLVRKFVIKPTGLHVYDTARWYSAK